MERILHQKHTKYTFTYACSRLLERAAFYGLRALIVLYMVSESLQMSDVEAMKVYAWFTGAIVFSQLIGALLGDLLLGNKRALIIGGVLQAIGAFSFCIPSVTGLYLGLFLVVLGGGLYTPNIISHFGKLYLNNTKLLDAGFTILYLAVNIGGFIGPFFIGYLGHELGWTIGFSIAGILMLFSIIFPLLSRETVLNQILEKDTGMGERVVKILIAFVLVGLFWAIYEVSSIGIFDLQIAFSEFSSLNILKNSWASTSTVFIVPISLAAIILWSYFYNSQFVKLTVGFLLGAISFGILLFIPEVPADQHIALYLISLVLLSLAEIHIAPIIHSVLTQYANPKYLAILISLAFVPTKILSLLIGLFYDELSQNPMLALKLALIAMIAICAGLVSYVLLTKKWYARTDS
ncbi:MFS transporter [Spongiimicrobium sp. 2-473A-2-J]|uniref:MFS transporter n=1 Tax=Eudoraea algarum TaxID=3417568 RepID=UPI003D362822